MSNCIKWTGAYSSTGYGAKWAGGKMVGAHRHAYESASGEIPKGMMVLHSCDNKACINPQHLRLGTAKDNAKDAVDRGLIATGERHGRNTIPESRLYGQRNPMSKLTDEQTGKVLLSRRAGRSLRDIAGQYGVSISTVSRICRGERHALIAALEEK